MIKVQNLIILTGIVLISSCSPKISTAMVKNYNTLEYTEEVLVFEQKDELPDNAEVLGLIVIRDTGFTIKCNYETVLEKAKLEARKVGGNAIKITMHKKPNFWSTCHRIDASVIRLNN